jgi:hypothetical protein
VPGVFVIVRDARGSLVHVRRRDDGECIGCIEAGLFEVVRALVLEEGTAARTTEGSIGWLQPSPAGSVAPPRGRKDDGG